MFVNIVELHDRLTSFVASCRGTSGSDFTCCITTNERTK